VGVASGGVEIAYTDNRGVFVISNMRPAAYDVRISMARFLSVRALNSQL
jgi:hypothetical protein